MLKVSEKKLKVSEKKKVRKKKLLFKKHLKFSFKNVFQIFKESSYSLLLNINENKHRYVTS